MKLTSNRVQYRPKKTAHTALQRVSTAILEGKTYVIDLDYHDLFRLESLTLQTHWVLVVMDQFTRRIIGFGIHRGIVDGTALCCMFRQAIRQKSLSKYLSTDNDPLFRFHQWQANLRILEVTEIKTVPGVSIRRKADRNDPMGVSGSNTLLDYGRPRRNSESSRSTLITIAPMRGWEDSCQ